MPGGKKKPEDERLPARWGFRDENGKRYNNFTKVCWYKAPSRLLTFRK